MLTKVHEWLIIALFFKLFNYFGSLTKEYFCPTINQIFYEVHFFNSFSGFFFDWILI